MIWGWGRGPQDIAEAMNVGDILGATSCKIQRNLLMSEGRNSSHAGGKPKQVVPLKIKK